MSEKTEFKKPEFTSERHRMGYKEMTRDPIFLFQRKLHHFKEDSRVKYDSDLEGIVLDDPDPTDEDNLRSFTEGELMGEDTLSNKKLEEMEIATPYWDTELVFYSREEGEAYGESRSYNYRNGWRVYCVCAEGDLKGILLAQDGPVGAAQRPAERLKTGFDYFSCPTCRCCWFRMYGHHKKDEIECRNCGWNGPRKAGESARFFTAAESKN